MFWMIFVALRLLILKFSCRVGMRCVQSVTYQKDAKYQYIVTHTADNCIQSADYAFLPELLLGGCFMGLFLKIFSTQRILIAKKDFGIRKVFGENKNDSGVKLFLLCIAQRGSTGLKKNADLINLLSLWWVLSRKIFADLCRRSVGVRSLKLISIM